MRILITNDDGIHGEGLAVLEDIACQLSDDVWIVAPETDQSGASHSLTLRYPIRVRKFVSPRTTMKRSAQVRYFAVEGTPTDCVLTAVSHLMKDKKPDIVLSGINDGANVAEDVTYSGTVAGAMEGALLGLPSFAFSLVRTQTTPPQWSTARHYGYEALKKFIDISIKFGTLMNINIPNCAINEVQGIRVCTQGRRSIPVGIDLLEERKDPRGKDYYWIGTGSTLLALSSNDLKTDLHALSNCFVSVTPLSLDLTDTEMLNRLHQRGFL